MLHLLLEIDATFHFRFNLFYTTPASKYKLKLKCTDVLIDLYARHNRLHNLSVSAFDARIFTILG
jgi:hypothetical protein